jgi:hypothetical protein
MTSWQQRVCGASVAVAVGFLALALACSGEEYGQVGAENEQVGKVGQPCFPGDFCDNGLTCIATAIPSEAASLGTDGGKCFDLAEAGHDGGAEDGE